MKNSTLVFERLLETLSVNNLDEAANKLDINPSTLRGRKSRGAVPFEHIVQKLDSKDLIYVLKGERINPEDFRETGVPQRRIEEQFERFSVELIERIEAAPFSHQAKLRIIDTLIRIVEQDLSEISAPGDSDSKADDQT